MRMLESGLARYVINVLSLAGLLTMVAHCASATTSTMTTASASFTKPLESDRLTLRGWNILFSRYKDIYTVNLEDGEVKRLTYTEQCGGCFNLQPTWSPDGSQIAFTSNRGGDFDIYVMKSDGSDQRRLTNMAGRDSSPAWSPRGDQIAFVNGGDTTFAGMVNSTVCNHPNIYLVSADGGLPVKLTDKGANTDPSWSPDGKRIAFTSDRDGDYEIYLLDVGGDRLVQLTYNEGVDDVDPSWSPDGASIAFGRGYAKWDFCRMEGIIENPLGPDTSAWGADLYVVGVDGSGLERLTFNGNNSDPAWSSNGSGLAFTKGGDAGFELFYVELAGLSQTRVADGADFDLSPSCMVGAASGAGMFDTVER
jgi:Tol biopolymer transport system component